MNLTPPNSIKIFPSYLDWSKEVNDISLVPPEATELRLLSKTKGFEKLPLLKYLKSLWCFDVNSESLNHIGDSIPLENLFIEGFKSDSFQCFKKLNSLKVLHVAHCSKINSLDELSDFQNLEGLAVVNFRNVHEISVLSRLTMLDQLAITGSVWTRMKIESLKPLSLLRNLKYLNLSSLKVEDESLKPLAALEQLEELILPNYYPMEQFAWLSGKLKNTRCSWFQPYVKLPPLHCRKCRKDSIVMLTGKGKPNLCRDCDASRLAKHVSEFEKIVASVELEIE